MSNKDFKEAIAKGFSFVPDNAEVTKITFSGEGITVRYDTGVTAVSLTAGPEWAQLFMEGKNN